MFSGIVSHCARVISLQPFQNLQAWLEVENPYRGAEVACGDSISVDGVCLTVREINESGLRFDLSNETLARTSLAKLKAQDTVHLELALQLGQRLHGHLVFGHVDACVEVLEKVDCGDQFYELMLTLPSDLKPLIAPKGSLALSGVSLTATKVDDKCFSVSLVPETIRRTKLGSIEVGCMLNLEVDMLARYVASNLSAGGHKV